MAARVSSPPLRPNVVVDSTVKWSDAGGSALGGSRNGSSEALNNSRAAGAGEEDGAWSDGGGSEAMSEGALPDRHLSCFARRAS